MSYGDVQLRQSPIIGPATSPGDVSSTTPDDLGVGDVASTPLGITAGTTHTAFDPSAVDRDTDGASSSEPTPDQWRQIGMTDHDVAYLRSVGMHGNNLRSFYQSAAAQAGLAQNPGPVTGADPLAGTPLEGAGLLYDSQSGLAVDPKSGNVYDPQSGAQLDPNTGQPITSADDSAPAAAPGVGDSMPGWSDAYETKFAKVFADAGASPEVAQILIDGLKNSTPKLNTEQLDAGLQFYSGTEGKAQIAKMVSTQQSGVPVSAMVKMFAPYVAGAVGVGGGVAYAVNTSRHALANHSIALAQRAAGGDGVSVADQAAAKAQIAGGGRAARTAGAILSAPNEALQTRGSVGLQLAMEREQLVPAAERGAVSPTVSKLLEGTTPSAGLKDLATKFQVPIIAGESPSSLANRIAHKQGVGVTDAGARAFVTPGDRAGNTGGGGSFRSYQPPENVHVGKDWASYRASADNMGVGILHPMEKFRLAAAATAQGPEFTRMGEVAAQVTKNGGGTFAQTVKGILPGVNAGIAARGASGTLMGGLAGITKDSLHTMAGKAGMFGAAIGAVTELPSVAKVVGAHGIDSKESGDAIGGAVGRVGGNFAGFVAGQAVGTTVGVVAGEAGATLLTSVLAGSAIGTAIPIPGVGTAVGAIVGLGVGIVAGNYAGKYLGAAGEHVGDALSWVNKETGLGTVLGGVNKASNKIDDVLDAGTQKANDVADKIVPSFAQGPVHGAIKGAEEVTKVVVNPLGAAKDAGHAVVAAGSGVANVAKKAWHGVFG